jgi:cardiolipin synthase
MRATFNRDLAAANAVTLEQWQRRPLDQRLKEALGRLWEYWL